MQNGLVPNLNVVTESQERYLGMRWRRVQGEKSQLYARLHILEYWCQEEKPPRYLAVKIPTIQVDQKTEGNLRHLLKELVHRFTHRHSSSSRQVVP